MSDLQTPPPSDDRALSDAHLERALAAAFGVDADEAEPSLDPAPRVGEGDGAAPPADLDHEPRVGDRFAGLTLVARLGQGGMGEVFEARQDFPARTVAVKFVRAHLASPGLLARFEREARLLARLSHPGIARVFAAGRLGVRGTVLPYLVMERVHGRSLDEWVRAVRPGRRARLLLLADLADAVQHAHQRGVIHRDIKPGNVLVEEGGHPRLLDFGIAREVDLGEQTLETQQGQVLGTLPFMAPEQLAGEPDRIDTRADVYSLGVVLHYLLVERVPFELAGRSPASAARVVTEEPLPPLARADRSLRGDLESIVTQALEKDPERRYGSAGDLAADLRRHLAGEAVLARRAGALYQLRCLVRRHRLAASGLGAAVLLLAGGGYVSAALLSIKNAEVVRAQEETRGINEFLLEEVLFAARPDRAQGTEPSVREAVERAARRVDGADLAPAVEGAVRETLGEVFWKLSRLAESEAQLRLARELYGEVRGPLHERTLRVQERLARVLGELGAAHRDEAWALARELRSARAEQLGPEHPQTLRADFLLANLQRDGGDVEGSLEAFRRIAEVRARVLGPDDEGTLYALSNVAEGLELLGRPRESLPLRRALQADYERLMGEDHPETLTGMNNLANVLCDLGEVEEPERLYREALARTERVHGPDSLDVSSLLNNLGVLLQQTGRREEAAALAERCLAIREREYGARHRRVLLARHNLAVLRHGLAPGPDTRAELEAVHRLREEVLGPGDRDTLASLATRAEVELRRGEPALALDLLEVSLSGVEPDPEHWTTGLLDSLHGEALLELGRAQEARPILTRAHGTLVGALPGDHRFLSDVRGLLARVERDLGDEAAARAWEAPADGPD